jgi:hypothetical protein
MIDGEDAAMEEISVSKFSRTDMMEECQNCKRSVEKLFIKNE